MPSGSRGAVSTTSGRPHGQRCATRRTARGGRPSCSATAASSVTTVTLPRPVAGRCLSACCTEFHSRSYHGWPRPGLGRAVPRPAADDHVAGLARACTYAACPGLLLHVGRMLSSCCCCCSDRSCASVISRCAPAGRSAGLGDVLPHRVGQAQRDRADHYRQHRGPAGQPGPVRWRRPPALRHHCADGVRGKAAAPGVGGGVAEQFLDPQQLVVLGDPLRPGRARRS